MAALIPEESSLCAELLEQGAAPQRDKARNRWLTDFCQSGFYAGAGNAVKAVGSRTTRAYLFRAAQACSSSKAEHTWLGTQTSAHLHWAGRGH